MPAKKPTRLLLKYLSRLWGPFLGSNIRVTKVSPDFHEVETQMKLGFFNRSWATKAHYGGSLFSMADPMYMIMLINILGRDYVVWDKSSCIEFKKSAKTHVGAKYQLSEERIQEIIEKTKSGDPYFAKFEVNVMDTNQEVVATVDKVVYVRRKKGR